MILANNDVMTQTEGHNVSSRYVPIPTLDVVQMFERYGFEMNAMEAVNARNADRVGKAKHMIRMQADYTMAGGLRPEVIIVNSHDGKSAMSLRIGLYRMACANGLFAGHNLVPATQVAHNNGWENMVNEFIDTYEVKHRKQVEWVSEMQERRMSLDEAYYMAEKALGLRHLDKRINNNAVDPLELLLVKRAEDKGDSAFLRFNVLQEHLVNGEYRKYDDNGRIKKAQVLTAVDELVRFNVELSDLFSGQIIV